MKKCLKWIVRAILILLVVLIAAAVAGVIFLDQVAKGSIETAAPIVTGVPVTVESISIQPLRGRVEILNFEVGNPAGYASSHAIKLGDVAVEVIPASLLADKIVIPELRLRDIIVNYETPITFTSSNLQDILDHIEQLAGKEEKAAEEKAPAESSAPAAKEETASAEPEKQKKEIRLQLDKIIIDNIQLRVVSKGTEIMFPLIVELPDMGPIGTSPEGVTPLGLTKEISSGLYEGIYNSVLKSKDEILKAFANVGAEALKVTDDAAKAAKELGNNLKESAEGLKNVGEDLKDTTKELENIGKDLKNLFK